MQEPIRIKQKMIEYEIRGGYFRRYSNIGGYTWKYIIEAATPFDEDRELVMSKSDVPYYEELQTYLRREKLKRILK